ncbi:MAG: DUF389 domain-containing protein [Gammaproteobacteria bacterium]|nr:DUF389 domain-containing protein [Gammaproteobacteria bacterium]
MTGVSSALVGVAIAVALIPPAATVGIGIAWGVPDARGRLRHPRAA